MRRYSKIHVLRKILKKKLVVLRVVKRTLTRPMQINLSHSLKDYLVMDCDLTRLVVTDRGLTGEMVTDGDLTGVVVTDRDLEV